MTSGWRDTDTVAATQLFATTFSEVSSLSSNISSSVSIKPLFLLLTLGLVLHLLAQPEQRRGRELPDLQLQVSLTRFGSVTFREFESLFMNLAVFLIHETLPGLHGTVYVLIDVDISKRIRVLILISTLCYVQIRFWRHDGYSMFDHSLIFSLPFLLYEI